MSDSKLSLTPEQQELLAKYRMDYFNIGWGKTPTDRPTAEKAISDLYRLLKKDPPKFQWFESPAGACACMRESGVNSSVLVGTEGHLDSYWVALYMFARNLPEVKYSSEDDAQLLMWDNLVKSCGPCYPFTNYCLMTEKPVKATYDERELLHCSDGPAVLYKDGFSVYAFHGIYIPARLAWAIDRPWTITMDAINKESGNTDLQTILQSIWCYEEVDAAGERVGTGGGRWLAETGSEVVHEDEVTYGDTIIARALFMDKRGQKFLCCSDGTTDRVYFIRANNSATTCAEAHASFAGVADTDVMARS